MADKRLELVEIEWVDITSNQGWTPLETAALMKPMAMRTTGYLLNKDKDLLRLVMTESEDSTTNIVKVFPMGCIKKVHKLRRR